MPAMWKASAGGSCGSAREVREGLEREVSGMGDQHQYLPGSVHIWLMAGAPSQTLEPFFPFWLRGLGLGLLPCLGFCNCGCLGLLDCWSALMPLNLEPHDLFLNLWIWGAWPWLCLGLLSPRKGGEVPAFRFMLLGGLGLDRPDRTK